MRPWQLLAMFLLEFASAILCLFWSVDWLEFIAVTGRTSHNCRWKRTQQSSSSIS